MLTQNSDFNFVQLLEKHCAIREEGRITERGHDVDVERSEFVEVMEDDAVLPHDDGEQEGTVASVHLLI